jgi:pilus assembly protein Flp/PilA
MIDAVLMTSSWLAATGRIQRDDRGASLVEYALLLALIALVCIAALTLLGENVATEYNDAGVSVANAN